LYFAYYSGPSEGGGGLKGGKRKGTEGIADYRSLCRTAEKFAEGGKKGRGKGCVISGSFLLLARGK